MTEMTKSKVQMFAVWCGIAYLVCVFAGWGLCAGFLPPTDPSDSAREIGALFGEDHTRIRIGMLIVMLAALVFIPFAAVMTRFISRVEGGPGVLTYTFLLGAAGNMCLTFYPAVWWLAAAFRPDRGDDLIYLINDVAWLQFLGGITMYLAMPFTVMVAALSDQSDRPPFPRWAGYANAAVGVIIIPDQLLFFFKTGPFAWNGLFGIWVPVVVFSGFFIINVIALRQTILRERGEPERSGAMAAAPA